MNFQNPINNFAGLNKPDAIATEDEQHGVEYLRSLPPLERLRLGYQILGVEIKEPKM